MNHRELAFRALVTTTRLLRRTAKFTGRLAQRFRPPPQRIRDLFPVMTTDRRQIEYAGNGKGFVTEDGSGIIPPSGGPWTVR